MRQLSQEYRLEALLVVITAVICLAELCSYAVWCELADGCG